MLDCDNVEASSNFSRAITFTFELIPWGKKYEPSYSSLLWVK